ncbi:MAG: transposase [Planctomycetota bacterium]
METSIGKIAPANEYATTHQATTEPLSRSAQSARDVVLTFYDFPPGHGKHVRTTNPVESMLAPVSRQHRSRKSNGGRAACLTMVFKLAPSAVRRCGRGPHPPCGQTRARRDVVAVLFSVVAPVRNLLGHGLAEFDSARRRKSLSRRRPARKGRPAAGAALITSRTSSGNRALLTPKIDS